MKNPVNEVKIEIELKNDANMETLQPKILYRVLCCNLPNKIKFTIFLLFSLVCEFFHLNLHFCVSFTLVFDFLSLVCDFLLLACHFL